MWNLLKNFWLEYYIMHPKVLQYRKNYFTKNINMPEIKFFLKIILAFCLFDKYNTINLTVFLTGFP